MLKDSTAVIGLGLGGMTVFWHWRVYIERQN